MTTIDQRSIVENLSFCDRQNIIWDCNCNPTEKLVLLALNNRASDLGYCFADPRIIARQCRVSKPKALLDRLVRMGLLRECHKYDRYDMDNNPLLYGYQILFGNLMQEESNE